jgi:hypothetical protein
VIETVRYLIDALKKQPALLALTAVDLAMILFIFYALHGAALFRDKMLAQNFEMQRQFNELLSKCVIPKGSVRIETLPDIMEQ